MDPLHNFATNLKVWSRRFGIQDLSPKVQRIAAEAGGRALGRQTAIWAVAVEYFVRAKLHPELAKDCAAVAALDVYQGVYYPEERAPAVGLDESIVRNPQAMEAIERFCREARVCKGLAC